MFGKKPTEKKSTRSPKKKDEPKLKVIEDPKDPYRWVTLLVFLILLFISYAFWARGQH